MTLKAADRLLINSTSSITTDNHGHSRLTGQGWTIIVYSTRWEPPMSTWLLAPARGFTYRRIPKRQSKSWSCQFQPSLSTYCVREKTGYRRHRTAIRRSDWDIKVLDLTDRGASTTWMSPIFFRQQTRLWLRRNNYASRANFRSWNHSLPARLFYYLICRLKHRDLLKETNT